MAIDVTNLVKSLGINVASGTHQQTANSVSNAGGKAPKPASGVGAFASGIVHSAENIAGGVAGAAAHSLTSSLGFVGHGIAQGLPGIGSMHLDQNLFNQRQASIDNASRAYHQQLASGKISRDRYTKLIQDLNTEQQGMNKDLQSRAKSYVKPKDFATGLATVASLPFAGGNLVGEGKIAQALGATAQAKSGIVGAALKAPIKAALIDAPTATTPVQVASDIKDKKYGNAALNAATLAVPAASALLPRAGKALGEAVLGKAAGPVKAFFGDSAVEKASQNPEVANLLKQAEGFTMSQPGVKNAKQAAPFFKNYLTNVLHLPENTTPEEFAQRAKPYFQDLEKLQAAKASGAADARTAITASFKQSIPAALDRVGANFDTLSPLERTNAVKSAVADLKLANPRVVDEIGNAAFKSETLADFKNALGTIDKYQEIKVPGFKPSKGFMLTYGPKAQAVLPTVENAPELTAGKSGRLGFIGDLLKKTGLSPEATDSSQVRGLLNKSLDNQLAGTKFEGQGKDLLSKLSEAMNQTKGVFDPRLLRATPFAGTVNIEDALGVSADEARQISKALRGAYADLPISVRGAGQKLTDKAIQLGGPAMTNYLKAQGYGRFTANPFFMAKQAIKGEFIAQAETGGKSLNFGRALNKLLGTAPSNDTQTALAGAGWFSKGRVAGSEGDFFGNFIPGEVKKNIATKDVQQYIRQSMGQVAEAYAKKQGTTVTQIMSEGGKDREEMDKALQMVVGYPKDGYLDSNLAKSLNVLVFPSRFETKVGLAMAKYVSQQPPVVQAALARDLITASQWGDSPEGKKFKKDNADLLGAIDYFSPTHTIESVFKALGSRSLGDLGSFGGMPFGVITTILKNQGVKVPNALSGSQDINPKTGQPYQESIPTTDKARIQTALSDLIGSMFSWPGKTVGLQSKRDVIQTTLTGGALKPDKGSTKSVAAPASTAPATPTTAVVPQKFATQYGQAQTGVPSAQLKQTVAAATKAKAKKAKPKAFRPRAL